MSSCPWRARSSRAFSDARSATNPPAFSQACSFVAAAGLSWIAFYHVGFLGEEARVPLLPFIGVGDLQTSWSLRIDTLTAVMLVVVTTVSALVHIYSVGYMSDDDRQPLFFAELSLFTFAMLSLVTADNFDPALLRLGGRGARLLPADRLLVSPAFGELRPRSRPSS